ncbi:MAG: tetratricopeptide repeat protein, partial [Pseudomonadota bacterium]
AEIKIDLAGVRVVGEPGHGAFLEGISIPEDGFNEWVAAIRAKPEQLFSLYGPTFSGATTAVVPTISILPFSVVFGDDSHRVLGDWLAEQICRSLSRSNLVAVISHLSARALSLQTLALGQVREQLNVDYCVTGTLRVIDDTVILDADFIDATSGRILWTRNFTGSQADFMTGNSNAEIDIVRSVGRSIASDAIQHTRSRQLHEIEDHHLLIAGVGLMNQLRLSSFARSREMINEAIRRAPNTAEAYAWLGDWYVKSVYNGWSTDHAADTQRARDATARALDIDPENAFSLTIDGVVNTTLTQELDVAEHRFDQALDRNPNEAMSWLQKGVLHAFRDESAEAVEATDMAQRLSPIDPFGYFFDSLSATAYFSAGDFQKSLEFSERSLKVNNRHNSTHRAQIAALYHLGREEEARVVAARLIERQPGFTVQNYLRNHPAAEQEMGRKVAEALRGAGVPE